MNKHILYILSFNPQMQDSFIPFLNMGSEGPKLHQKKFKRLVHHFTNIVKQKESSFSGMFFLAQTLAWSVSPELLKHSYISTRHGYQIKHMFWDPTIFNSNIKLEIVVIDALHPNLIDNLYQILEKIAEQNYNGKVAFVIKNIPKKLKRNIVDFLTAKMKLYHNKTLEMEDYVRIEDTNFDKEIFKNTPYDSSMSTLQGLDLINLSTYTPNDLFHLVNNGIILLENRELDFAETENFLNMLHDMSTLVKAYHTITKGVMRICDIDKWNMITLFNKIYSIGERSPGVFYGSRIGIELSPDLLNAILCKYKRFNIKELFQLEPEEALKKVKEMGSYLQKKMTLKVKQQNPIIFYANLNNLDVTTLNKILLLKVLMSTYDTNLSDNIFFSITSKMRSIYEPFLIETPVEEILENYYEEVYPMLSSLFTLKPKDNIKQLLLHLLQPQHYKKKYRNYYNFIRKYFTNKIKGE